MSASDQGAACSPAPQQRRHSPLPPPRGPRHRISLPLKLVLFTSKLPPRHHLSLPARERGKRPIPNVAVARHGFSGLRNSSPLARHTPQRLPPEQAAACPTAPPGRPLTAHSTRAPDSSSRKAPGPGRGDDASRASPCRCHTDLLQLSSGSCHLLLFLELTGQARQAKKHRHG